MGQSSGRSLPKNQRSGGVQPLGIVQSSVGSVQRSRSGGMVKGILSMMISWGTVYILNQKKTKLKKKFG